MAGYFSEFVRFCLWFLTGFVRLRGRATRSELMLFLFAGTPLAFLAESIQEYLSGERVFGNSPLSAVIFLFLVPVFIRRLHDQDKSEWFAIVLILVGGLKAWNWHLQQTEGLGTQLPFPFNLVELASVLAFFVLALWSPMQGANQHGPNPRRGKRAESA